MGAEAIKLGHGTNILHTARILNVERVVYEINVMVYLFQYYFSLPISQHKEAQPNEMKISFDVQLKTMLRL